MATATKLKLHTMLGNYANTKPLKSGAIHSDLVDFDFAEVKVANNLFKQVVREAKYDVAELAIVTYLQAKAYGKPYVLVPAVVVSRGQHHTIAYNPERGPLKPYRAQRQASWRARLYGDDRDVGTGNSGERLRRRHR